MIKIKSGRMIEAHKWTVRGVSRASAVLLLTGLVACGPETTSAGKESPVVEASSRPINAPVEPIVDDVLMEPVAAEPEAYGNSALREEIREKLQVGLLLPLTGADAAVGQSLMDATMLAYFDAYDPRISLIPFDTQGTAQGAREALVAAIEAGSDVIIGPLRGDNLLAIADQAAFNSLPIFSFSNDVRAAGSGRYVMGFAPEEEVDRVITFAADKGRRNFASLTPVGLYGDRVENAFGQSVLNSGADPIIYERYVRINDEVFDPVKRLSNYDARRKELRDEIRFLRGLGDDMTNAIADDLEKKNEIRPVPFDAVLIAEGGSLLRTIAPLFPFYEVDQPEVRFLGTGLMNDPSLANEPPLYGAWFAAPPRGTIETFEERFKNAYQTDPTRVSVIAYDTMAMIAALMREDGALERLAEGSLFAPLAVTRAAGFRGASGLFRLTPDGRVERSLSIFEIRRSGLVEVDPAPQAFPAFIVRN